MDVILSVRHFSAKFGQKLILSDVNFDLTDRGVTVLMGPCGTGKSTLLRSLSGINDSSNIFHREGTAYYLGNELGKVEFPAMVTQKPNALNDSLQETIIKNLNERDALTQEQGRQFVLRLLDVFGVSDKLAGSISRPVSDLPILERKLVSMLAIFSTSPKLIFLDEPTTYLNESDANILLAVIKKMAEKSAVVVVLHNQKQAKQISQGDVILLAGGVIHEHASVELFFNAPKSQAAKDFIRTGSCAVPSPAAPAETLDPEFIARYQPAAPAAKTEQRITPFGPRGFKWIIRDSLAAFPRPGLLEDLEFDLKALQKVKIDELVTLEEELTVPPEMAANYGINVSWLPIPDMGVPGMNKMNLLVAQIDQMVQTGKRVGVHCKAGLGRTGTVLVAYMIYKGHEVGEALHQVRFSDPRMVQSTEQEVFLHDYARQCG